MAGAKIYCANWMWGSGVDVVVAIGRHRGSSQLIELVMSTRQLTHFRAQHVHRPAILRKLERSAHAAQLRTRAWCEQLAVDLNKWFAPTAEPAARKETFAVALRLMREDAQGIALRDRALETLDDPTGDNAAAVFVLCDYLEQHGALLSYDDVITTLRRQRDNR